MDKEMKKNNCDKPCTNMPMIVRQLLICLMLHRMCLDLNYYKFRAIGFFFKLCKLLGDCFLQSSEQTAGQSSGSNFQWSN